MAPQFLTPPAVSLLQLKFIKVQFKKQPEVYSSAVCVSSITPSLPKRSWQLMQQPFLNVFLWSVVHKWSHSPCDQGKADPRPFQERVSFGPSPSWWLHASYQAGLAQKTKGEAYGGEGTSEKDLFTFRITLPPLLYVGGDAWDCSSHPVPSLRMQPTHGRVQKSPREEELVLRCRAQTFEYVRLTILLLKFNTHVLSLGNQKNTLICTPLFFFFFVKRTVLKLLNYLK